MRIYNLIEGKPTKYISRSMREVVENQRRHCILDRKGEKKLVFLKALCYNPKMTVIVKVRVFFGTR